MEIIMTNPPGVDNFIEISRMVTGNAVYIQDGMDFGAIVSIDDSTQTRRTDGGNTIIDRRPLSKSISLDLSMLKPADRAAVQQIVRRNGAHTPVFISAYQSAPYASTRADFQIYGYSRDLSGMSLNSAVHSSLRLRIDEI